MSNDIYIKPLARKDENGNTIYFSAYTNRKIKIYPGETPQQRELRLRRNFETTKKTRKMQESMLRECKEEKNRLSEENRELLVMKQKLSVRILEEDLYYSKREQQLANEFEQLMTKKDQLRRTALSTDPNHTENSS